LYAPDPSSQGACTLGGNIANNAGGPHTLKYGVTANHVLSVEMVLPDGEVVVLGDKTEDTNGYDLLGLALGSEGTFGIVTQATVRLVRKPQAVRTLLAIFNTVDDATETVSAIVASGIVPAALEMMDGVILQTVEDAFHFGFPRDAGAILIIELDGLAAGLDAQAARVRALCDHSHAREIRQAETAKDRANLWAARKKAVGTLGRLAPSCVTQDCVIPRSKLPEVLRAIAAIGAKYSLRIANVFHAGDGNLHPATLFDERNPDEVRRVMAASHEILELCVGLGGTLTGEHGIGVEKRDYMPLLFPPETLQTMSDLRAVFNPQGLCNPDKVLPTAHGCAYDFRPRGGAVAV
ncbi:MAG: FAD-binding protein, partial [Armatimonadota bacterium]|nr:FAD-binding protein [Armatimonadota bacterium]